ncbi:Pyridoxal phosphate-dependent transferase, major region, subdomain 2 [Penicillium digitatum]|uniref:Pyridoxal phosphate-dependent transferase, major region, subdomain 2 n=1 Tax=Penicillium digitatum TaxID=36651 RepID=A0A7T6XW79_PENDI|nr:Pyridoxal phosphate-dependent transferase, major region, subdomain 2 [Penicillium digitatum]
MTNETKASALLHRNTRFIPKKAIGGKGCYIFLEDGTKFLDATGGAAVSCLGHGNEQVAQIIKDQMDQISYCHSAFFSTQVAEDLAKLLVDSTEGKLSKVFITSSEAALKLARQFFLELPTPQTERTRFIARLPSYHGTTLGALSVGGHVQRREPFEPLLSKNVSHVSPCYAYRGKRDSESNAEYVARLSAELDAEFQRVGPETVCAFIAEPVVGAALGCVPAVPGYFRAMKAVCEKHGALLILDEIMSGMGRSGTLHAWEQEDVVPDIQTIAKGLGGGYAPVSAVLINDSIVQTMDKGTGQFRHGQTYQGHPVSCAAAFAVQKTIQEHDSRVILTGDIRGKGLFWGLEFVKDKATKEPFDPKDRLSYRIQEKGLEPEHGVSLYGCSGTVDGVKGDHLMLAPPNIVSEEEIDIIVATLGNVLKEVFASL